MRPNPPGIARFAIALAAITICLISVGLAQSPTLAVVWASSGIIWAAVFFVVLDQDKTRK